MRKVKELKYTQVYKTCDLCQLKFKTTDDLAPCTDYIGQERAIEAINFGLGMEFRGYNLYLSGPTGVGKTTTIETILSSIAKEKPSPTDWCYVFNFRVPNEAQAIELPKGKAKEFKNDMEEFLRELKINIPKAFESNEFEEKNMEHLFIQF